MTDVDLHPDVTHLAPLIGTWVGEGEGHYPTIDDFAYEEEVTFGHVGKPFLTYQQRTRYRVDGRALHAEVGYLRPVGLDAVEFVLAHPTGIAEVEEGGLHPGSDPGELVIELATTVVGLASTAKRVNALRRRFVLAADRFTYDLWLDHADTGEHHHLRAALARTH